MPAPLPDCPKCDCAHTLQAFRADTKGLRWCECSGCNEVVLVDADGRIVHRVVRDAG